MRLLKTVYLAGPITGLSYDDARNGWRHKLSLLLPSHIKPVSPMRGKDFLRGEVDLDGSPEMYTQHVMATKKGIVCRDRNDVMTCDAMVANFVGYDRVSIGTCIEFGWADAFRKPIVMIIEEGNLHNHAMLDHLAGYVCQELEQAAHLLGHLLTPNL